MLANNVKYISFPAGWECLSDVVENRIQKILAADVYKRIAPKNENGCMLWRGSKNHCGYGLVAILPKWSIKAHRFIWELHNKATIPKGMVIMHTCDVKACVNPEHLKLGTIADNNLDKIQKGGHGSAKGEAHKDAKLTIQKVKEIRLKSKQGISMRVLSKEYGVACSNIYNVVSNKSWKHVK